MHWCAPLSVIHALVCPAVIHALVCPAVIHSLVCLAVIHALVTHALCMPGPTDVKQNGSLATVCVPGPTNADQSSPLATVCPALLPIPRPDCRTSFHSCIGLHLIMSWAHCAPVWWRHSTRTICSFVGSAFLQSLQL